MPWVFLKETLMFFLQNASLSLGLCLDSEEMRLGSTKTDYLMLIRCMLHVDYFQALRIYL